MNPAAIQNFDRRSRIALSLICLIESAFAIWLTNTNPEVFARYFRSANPVVATFVCVLLTSVILNYFQRRGWFAIVIPGKLFPRFVIASFAATMFAIVAIIVDFHNPFPADINVRSPYSWSFYPVMAFVAETVFHLVPLALVVVVVRMAQSRVQLDSKGTIIGKRIWVGMFVFVACLEPTFQVVFAAVRRPLSELDIFVAVYVFAFGLVQFYLFSRYDFVTMFGFRIIYYMYWHIIWGHLRLQILF